MYVEILWSFIFPNTFVNRLSADCGILVTEANSVSDEVLEQQILEYQCHATDFWLFSLYSDWLFNLYMINQSNKIMSSTIRMKWRQVGLSLFCYARIP